MEAPGEKNGPLNKNLISFFLKISHNKKLELIPSIDVLPRPTRFIWYMYVPNWQGGTEESGNKDMYRYIPSVYR